MPDLDGRRSAAAVAMAAHAQEEAALATSSDSLASLIPPEKKQSMQMFEETLKGMIQEARQMVKREETESGDEVQAQGDLELQVKLRERSPVWPATMSAERRSMRSPSTRSQESVISVTEVQAAAKQGRAD